jgi:hypothetical protein
MDPRTSLEMSVKRKVSCLVTVLTELSRVRREEKSVLPLSGIEPCSLVTILTELSRVRREKCLAFVRNRPL